MLSSASWSSAGLPAGRGRVLCRREGIDGCDEIFVPGAGVDSVVLEGLDVFKAIAPLAADLHKAWTQALRTPARKRMR